MRWITFISALLIAIVLDSVLREVWPGDGAACPSLLLILLVFIAMLAPSLTAYWAALAIGLVMDLQSVHGVGDSGHDLVVIGPSVVGCFVGAYVVIQLRPLVMRESPVALAILVFIAGIFVELGIVALLTARGLPFLTRDPIIGWGAPDQLVTRFFVLLYSAIVALPVGVLLTRTIYLWGFTLPSGKVMSGFRK